MTALFKQYWLALSLTLIVWLAVALFMGGQAFVLVVILTLLEITLSADNAVVNSRVLLGLSPLWRRLFLTVGIIIAVFVVRFALPILIVAVASSLSIFQTLHLALNDSASYSQLLVKASPIINAFGGSFLGLVAIFYFIDARRKNFWLQAIEKKLSRLAYTPYSRLIISVVLLGLIYGLVVASKLPQPIAIASGLLVAALLYFILQSANQLAARLNAGSAGHKVGWAALAAFIYLEVLDASFSLDGVVGAFALTDDIILIMAGLGVGAIWVRSLTVHITDSNSLLKYRFLESGAHWAIAFLSLVLVLKLFHIELFESIVGLGGLLIVGLSVLASRRERVSS